MVDILISTLHNVPVTIQDLMGVSKPPPVLCKLSETWHKCSQYEPNNSCQASTSVAAAASSSNSPPHGSVHQCRSFPRLQLFELIIHHDLKTLDFSQNKDWPESEQMQDVSRTLWKIISDRCRKLEKLIVPKELTYSSTMNRIFLNGGQNLSHLTLKRKMELW